MIAAQSSASIQISPKQLQVLKQVASRANRFYSATIGELAQALSISRTTVFEHVAALREKKLLIQSTGKARCLRLTPAGERLLKQSLLIERQQNSIEDNDSSCDFLLRGRVCAGYGIDAIEEQTPFSLKNLFGSRGEIFVLQVKGQSMVNAGICDGDFVICRSSQTADNAQLVVALLDDGQSATIKRFFKDENAIRLQPENDTFEPIYSRDCKIQAVVLGLTRKFPN